jgi:hypothetical protein
VVAPIRHARAVHLIQAVFTGDDDRLVLRIPWKKTPMKRRREIIVPLSVSTHEPRPIRAEIRATRMVEVGLMSSLPATSPASSRLLPGKNAAWLVNLILVIFVNKPGTAPGTGLESPETGSQNWRRRTLSRQQRPYAGYLNPRNARKTRAIPQRLANAGSYRSAWWPIEPVFTGKFPSIREKNREFCQIQGS